MGTRFQNSKILSFLELIWFILQGPFCPFLISSLKKREKDFDKVFFFTYLYYPTVFALPHFRGKAILIPTAHNENPIYFPRIRKVLQQSPILIVNTQEEQDLLEQSLEQTKDKIMTGGFGIDEIEQASFAQPALRFEKIPEEKQYILYLGRISKGKGVKQLLADFARFAKTPQGEGMMLVLAGSNDDGIDLSALPGVVYLGYLSNEEKIALIKNCLAIINPSPLESLSLILLEALACKKPALINGNNPVLVAYSKHTESVFCYFDDESLARSINYLRSKEWQHRAPHALDEASNWARTQFSWSRVLSAYQKAANG